MKSLHRSDLLTTSCVGGNGLVPKQMQNLKCMAIFMSWQPVFY